MSYIKISRRPMGAAVVVLHNSGQAAVFMAAACLARTTHEACMSPVTEHPTVVSLEGAYGHVESDGAEERDGSLKVLVNFENGDRLWVPADKLILQEDGNFQLKMALGDLAAQHTRPTVAARPSDLDALIAGTSTATSEAAPATSQSGTPPEEVLDEPYFPPAAGAPTPSDDFDRVQMSRVVDSYREDVGAVLMREEVEIRRVPVNEYVDKAPGIRYEDDRIIIPVLEEVLLVEKRLLLKEEVVVTKRRSHVPGEQRELRQRMHVIAEPTGVETGSLTGDEEVFRHHYDGQSFPGSHGYAYFEPAYHFGRGLQQAAQFQSQTWDQLEPQARALWERDNPGTWERVQPAVRFAWSTPPATG